ncbi:hypothetical protein HZH66_006817 [Vespula vulgaris]|uniref:Uncharacterized protein n=1 Tax=Vespula vulgaris TaxID=7454 RepID=A0A834K311_VESVU|nr:hypothetical protein HZH66_006817 [Vespula vulgaris]
MTFLQVFFLVLDAWNSEDTKNEDESDDRSSSLGSSPNRKSDGSEGKKEGWRERRVRFASGLFRERFRRVNWEWERTMGRRVDILGGWRRASP